MRKIVLDADPGVDEALAIAFALFDPDVEIVAATSVGGCVSPSVAAQNLQRIVRFLDPPRLPRLGVGTAPDDGLPSAEDFCADANFGELDALDGFGLPSAVRRLSRSAEKTICDAVRRYPGETSILALGPLTNVARAFRLDPELPFLLDRVVVAGGVFAAPGNASSCAEFNVFCDPVAARIVLRAPCAKTLVPLDLATQFRFSFDDLADVLANGDAVESEVGRLIRRLFQTAFRSRRRLRGAEEVYFQGLTAYFALVEPTCFSTFGASGDVETCGELTRGAIIVERDAIDSADVSRQVFDISRQNFEIVRDIDVDAVRRKFFDVFRRLVRQARRGGRF